MLNPMIDKAFILARISKKIECAAQRLGRMPAPGTQQVFCPNDMVVFAKRKTIEERINDYEARVSMN